MTRLFFGIEVHAPWPEQLPQGRLIDKTQRHLTLAFLGNTDAIKIKEALHLFPKPSFKLGFVGQFDQCLFFPIKHPTVVAWHVDVLEHSALLFQFHNSLIHWLKYNGFNPDEKRSFTPHVTLTRAPFHTDAWQAQFHTLPLLLTTIHLYESLGHSWYSPMWSFPLIAPFQEIEHTADRAYCVRGESFDQLFLHAKVALAFSCPELLTCSYFTHQTHRETLDDVIIGLNELIAEADQIIHCPFKAVSFHSRHKREQGIIHWEMIVDI